MPYWLTNPEHGVMPVYDLSDVERNKVHGWSLLNEGPSPVKPAARAPVVVTPEPVVEVPPKRKPGRPPKAKQ